MENRAFCGGFPESVSSNSAPEHHDQTHQVRTRLRAPRRGAISYAYESRVNPSRDSPFAITAGPVGAKDPPQRPNGANADSEGCREAPWKGFPQAPWNGCQRAPYKITGSRSVSGSPSVESEMRGSEQGKRHVHPGGDDGNHAHEFDEDVERGACCVLEGVADGVANDGGLVRG
jgi:hypothetical protein